MFNFPTRSALLDLFLSSDASSTMAFPSLGNSDHVIVSVSIEFPSNSKWDAPFHCIASDCSHADWDSLHDHLRDDPWDDIFKLSAPRKLALRTFGELTKVNLLYLLYSTATRCLLSSASDKAKLFAKNFTKNSNLDDSNISLPIFPSRTNLKQHNISITPMMVTRS